MTGAQVIARRLRQWGTRYVFGLPGTQNAGLYAELPAAGLSAVPAMHEMGAGFAALGHAAVTHQPAVLALIGGPGFSYAVTPLLEACLDSIPLVVLVFAYRPDPGRSFQAQEIDHVRLGEACTRHVLVPQHDEQVLELMDQAWRLAQQEEPGPVMVLIDSKYLQRSVELPGTDWARPPATEPSVVSEETFDVLARELQSAAQPLFIAGRGTLKGAGNLQRLAEKFAATVITTTSARGVLPESHPLVLRCDMIEANKVNAILDEHSTVFAWGVKFSANGSKGFALRITPEKLIHIDAAEKVLGANYPARICLKADVPTTLSGLVSRLEKVDDRPLSIDRRADHVRWRQALEPDPIHFRKAHIVGVEPPDPRGFFAGLRRLLPDDAIVVLDSGFHQNLARLGYPVHAPYGLLLPTGLQSMGYSLPVAVGAALAAPGRPIVALLGDGGLRMCGMELLSAAAQKIPLVAILFDDGFYGLIREQQLDQVGHSSAVALHPMDCEAWAVSQQALYFDGATDPEGAVRSALAAQQPSLVHIPLRETLTSRAARWKATLRRQAHRQLGIARRWWKPGR